MPGATLQIVCISWNGPRIPGFRAELIAFGELFYIAKMRRVRKEREVICLQIHNKVGQCEQS